MVFESLLEKIPFVKDLFTFSSKGQSVIGIDLGSSSVKVIQLRKEKERAILETYGELSSSAYGGVQVGQAAVLVEDKAVEMLKDIFKESNITAKEAAVSIPLKSSFVTVIELPDINSAKMEDVVAIEARRHIPVPISEVELNWWVIPRSEREESPAGAAEKRKKFKILLVAIHKDTFAKYKNIISRAGIQNYIFELEIFSIIRSVLVNEIAPVLVIDMGASTTKMAIVDYGILLVSYSINRGGQDLTIALSKSLNIDFSRAEEMKREIGLSEAPEHKEMVSVINPPLDYIFSEANSVIMNYQNKYNRAVSRVILTGGGSLLKGMSDYAVKKLGMEVTPADPFSRTQYPAFLNNVLKEAGPSFSVALGLALRKLQS